MAHPKQGYRLADGTKVPGTTTIIGRFKETGGLLYWACEQGKAIERGEIDKLYDKRDAAAEAGTLCHSMVEAHINGADVPDMSGYSRATIKQAESGFTNFLAWQDNNKIEIYKQEMQLVSQKHRYGGCPDAIGIDSQGRFCLLDWKTSNAVYQDYLIQLAAYNQLWIENNPLMPLDGGYHLCRFSKEYADFSHHYYADLFDAWTLFVLYRQAYTLDKLIKKRVK